MNISKQTARGDREQERAWRRSATDEHAACVRTTGACVCEGEKSNEARRRWWLVHQPLYGIHTPIISTLLSYVSSMIRLCALISIRSV
jgi:hypothetical protein